MPKGDGNHWVIPGSRLLVADKVVHLQSGSPPGRWISPQARWVYPQARWVPPARWVSAHVGGGPVAFPALSLVLARSLALGGIVRFN